MGEIHLIRDLIALEPIGVVDEMGNFSVLIDVGTLNNLAENRYLNNLVRDPRGKATGGGHHTENGFWS